ncbi:GNAT family N-acetyltransferase [Acidobacteriota bacterium]
MLHRVVNYTDDKFPQLVEFYDGLRESGLALNDREVRFLRTKLERPQYDPAKNLFVIEDEHKIIALLDIVSESQIKRVVLNCLVQPGHSYINLSSALMELGIIRSRELKGERIHVCLRESDHVGHDFFINEGYSRVRTFLDLEADLLRREDTSIKAGDVTRTSFSKGEEHKLAALQNGIFSGSWGFCPNTDDEVKYYLALTGIELEDVILLKDEMGIVGYCWAHESLSSSDTSKIARIHMIGVKRDIQGGGWGRKLLQLSYHLLRNQGFRKVELTVDSENKPACGLYAALGFKLKSSSFWFEKKL